MKHKINTTTMTPHDPAHRFFPEFTSLVIYVGGLEVVGAAVVEVDDRGRALLRFDQYEPVVAKVEPKPKPKPKPSVAPMPQPPVPIMAETRAEKPAKKLGLPR